MPETVTKTPPAKAAKATKAAKSAAKKTGPATNGAADTPAPTVNEAIVRRYLLWLEDPESIKDQDAIKAKAAELADTDDPIRKLALLKDLAELNVSDPTPLRDAFVRVALDYATEHGIPADAFIELRVPEDVLRVAGFQLPRANGSKGPRSAGPGVRQRAVAVPVEEIRAAALARFKVGDTFLLADVADLGGSPATQRKAVDEMVAAGQVERLGPVLNYTGRGRAPIQFKRIA